MSTRRLLRIRRWLRQHGPRIHRRRFCGSGLHMTERRVWLTTRATRSKRGRVFCSRACKEATAHPTRQVHERRAEVANQPRKCPRPDKRRFETEQDCRDAFASLLAQDDGLAPYLCRCKAWHVGHDYGRYGWTPPVSLRVPLVSVEIEAEIRQRMTPHAAHLAAQRPTPAPTEES